MKFVIAKIFNFLGISSLIFFLSKLWYSRSHIRVINYHGTPKNEAENFEAQLVFFKKHYADTNLKEFNQFMVNGIWTKSKPGLIISFDDALLSNWEVAVPLLQKHGFTGWFCIPSDFVDCLNQKQFMELNRINDDRHRRGGQKAMGWEELKKLKGKHVLVSHTKSHHRMSSSDTPETLHKEIVLSKEKIEKKSDTKIEIFCWVGGEIDSYTLEASKLIKDNYTYSFMTNNFPITRRTRNHDIQRTNVESRFPMFLLRFYLCGIYDLFYLRKRRLLAEKLGER